METMRRNSLNPTAIQAAAAAAVLGLVLAPSPVLARGITTVPSDISGVDNHFPAGLFNWSSSGCGGGGVDFCGTLDFCQDGDRFGYALPGETCQPYNGPTIRLAPGKKYRLTLRNTATFGVSTNIHTHGLHIVGAGDSDDVTRSVDSGDCLDYTWDIADDHPGGTHWYHSHMHLNSESQVGGGAIGLLIVEDNLDLDSDVPLWASYERVLQIFRSPEVGFRRSIRFRVRHHLHHLLGFSFSYSRVCVLWRCFHIPPASIFIIYFLHFRADVDREHSF